MANARLSNTTSSIEKNSNSSIPPLAWLAGGIGGLALGVLAALAMQTPLGSSIGNFFRWLLAANTTQVTWYITRAAGLTAYLLLWLSVAWGLAVSSKILDTLLHGSFTYDFHQFISLLSIGFIAIHLLSLLFDQYMPYSVAQLLIPGLSSYRPVWVGVGIVAFYLTLLVTITFYLRGRIGMKAFRTIHVFSLVAYLATTIHGLLSGTDSSLPAVEIMYAGSFLSVIFLTAYWLLARRMKNRPAQGKGKIAAPELKPQ